METNFNFIKTSDEETAQRLRKIGFVELAKEGNRYVFLNDMSKIDFVQQDVNVNFDNKLMF